MIKRSLANYTPFNLYLSFLRTEIPNIVQIMGLPTLFGVLLLNSPFVLIISPLVGIILWQFLVEKAFIFLKVQIKDSSSEINQHGLSDEVVLESWKKYMIFSSVVSAIIIVLIIECAKESFK